MYLHLPSINSKFTIWNSCSHIFLHIYNLESCKMGRGYHRTLITQTVLLSRYTCREHFFIQKMPNYDIWKILGAAFLRRENPYVCIVYTLIVSIVKRKTFFIWLSFVFKQVRKQCSELPNTDVLTCLTLLNPQSWPVFIRLFQY